MPKVIAVYEYRFVRPEDVRPDDLVIDDAANEHDLAWKARAMDFMQWAADIRKLAAERRAQGYSGMSYNPDALEAYAAKLEESAPTEERTICVRRNVL